MNPAAARRVRRAAALLATACTADPYLLVSAPDGGDAAVAAGPAAEPDLGAGSGGGRELCNGKDDDRDGMIDEGFDLSSDPDHCGECGAACDLANAFSRCQDGECAIEECADNCLDLDRDDATGCEYCCTPSRGGMEVCDGLDNDCDGELDEDFDLAEDPQHCGACGRRCALSNAVADCRDGDCVVQECLADCSDRNGDPDDGCEFCCTPDGGGEACDGLDNDCDGEVDEGEPVRGPCGSNLGSCRAGTEVCTGDGAVECRGERGPAPETCNGEDDDCDGRTDQDVPPDGACGTDRGECSAGARLCDEGEFVCVGAIGGSAEVCDGLDNDCDGAIDDGIPPGDPCGSDVGECRAGRMRCVGGVMRCTGEAPPSQEVCDRLDNDCDGDTDEDFQDEFDDNPLRCGGCAPCSLANAIAGCRDASCTVASCLPGWLDLDEDPDNGCEYPCVPTGPEICDGADNDCDGLADAEDPALVPPALDPCRRFGECAGATVECRDGRWRCRYPGAVELDDEGEVAAQETLCDGLDNDCDFSVDEAFAIGEPCDDGGIGACRRTGTTGCLDERTTGCLFEGEASEPSPELCNGIDDDCDGDADEDAAQDLVRVTTPGVDVWVFRHEASRADATADRSGSLPAIACSRGGVLPWASVAFADAARACRRTGMRLCTADEWETACASAAGRAYPYGDAYDADACNGNDHDTDPDTPEDDDGRLAAGFLPSCASADGALDLSGNLKEWTDDLRAAGPPAVYGARGGAYDNPARGLRCDFDFTAYRETFLAPNLGFRCCCSPGDPGCPPGG